LRRGLWCSISLVVVASFILSSCSSVWDFKRPRWRKAPRPNNLARVLSRAPQHAGALTGMGRVQFQEKNYNEAVSFLSKAVTSNPPLREAHYYLGLTDARFGRKDDSQKELATAAQIEHEEVEKHQHVLRILNLDQLEAPERKPNP